MNVQEFLAENAYAAATKRTYSDILARFIEEVDHPEELTAGRLILYLEGRENWGNARKRLALACIKQYLSWAYGSSHPARNARIKIIESKMPRTITKNQMTNLMASFDPYTPKGARDLALSSILLDTAIRESELCRLQQADTNTERMMLQVLVKGGRWRWAIFSDETAAHVERWKRYREQLNPQGFLFVNIKTGEGLTAGGLQSIVREWGRRAGFKLSPHDFRRGFATIGSENGAPHRALMAGGGWLYEGMVTKYTRSFELEAMRKWLPMNSLKDKV